MSKTVAAALVATSLAICAAPVTAQPDAAVADTNSVTSWGSVGNIAAYSFGTTTCNDGTEVVSWVQSTEDHPVTAQDLYRVENGLLEHIGMGWVLHHFCALNQSTCGACQGTGCESLGIGCATPNGSSLMGQQQTLGPRSEVNASTGGFIYPFGTAGQAGNTIFKRVQVALDDLDPVFHPNASYFATLQVVAADDAAASNHFDNVTYRNLTVTPAGPTFVLAYTGNAQPGSDPIQAWDDIAGNVTRSEVMTPETNGSGRIIVGSRVEDLGGGVFRYQYAFFNETSDRSVRGLSIPTPAGVADVTFHDVDYHSGEPYSGADWDIVAGGALVSWSTDTFGADPNANALRWGTTYSFSFEVAAPPVAATATIDLFKPGTGDTVVADILGPDGAGGGFIRGDVDGDSLLNTLVDALYLLFFQFAGGPSPPCLEAAEVDGDGSLNGLVDTLYLLNFGFSGGPPPALPFPDCSADPDPAGSLGCVTPTC